MGVCENMRDITKTNIDLLEIEKQKTEKQKANDYIKGLTLAINKDLYNYFISLFENETTAEKITDIFANCNLLESKNKKIAEISAQYQDSLFPTEMAEDVAKKAYKTQLKQAYKDITENFEAKQYFEKKETLKLIEEIKQKAEQEEEKQAKKEKRKNIFVAIFWILFAIIAILLAPIGGFLAGMLEDANRENRKKRR